MKVISEEVVMALLDMIQGNLAHTVKLLEIDHKHSKDDNINRLNLDRAKANLEAVERTMEFVKINSFEPSELYSTKEIA